MDQQRACLSVERVEVRFGGLLAVSQLTFEVYDGEILSLIGPNGAGKTTAFNVITGYQAPTGGEARYNGVSLTGLPPNKVAELGLVRTFQKTSVFPALGVQANVMIGLHLRGSAGVLGILARRASVRAEEARLAEEAAGIIAFVGLEHRRREAASDLPYGEQRLVELAVALAARPRMLLLDEPAAGMTGAEKERLMALIRRIREQGMTVFVVEHDMRLVMGVSDTVIVLNHGRVIAEGAPAAIQRHPEVIRAYLGSAHAQA